MYLQGNLQAVFDALYHLGIIDPVLEMDWSDAIQSMPGHAMEYKEVVVVANKFQTDVQSLMLELERFDEKALGYLAMEVAREFADYHSRETIH